MVNSTYDLLFPVKGPDGAEVKKLTFKILVVKDLYAAEGVSNGDKVFSIYLSEMSGQPLSVIENLAVDDRDEALAVAAPLMGKSQRAIVKKIQEETAKVMSQLSGETLLSPSADIPALA